MNKLSPIAQEVAPAASSPQHEGWDRHVAPWGELDRDGTVNDWSKPLAAGSSVVAAKPLIDAIAPLTQTGGQILQLDSSGGFKLRSMPIFEYDGATKYARPETYKDWRFAVDEAQKMSSSFDTKSGLFILACAILFLVGELVYILDGGWIVGVCVGEFFASAVLSFWFAKAHRKFLSFLRKMQPAEPGELAPLVALKIVGDEDLASRWEGVLQHAEKTSIPVLLADVDQFLSGPDLRPAAVSVSAWRP